MASAPDADRDDVVEVAPDRRLGAGALVAGLLILSPALATASPESRPLALLLLGLLVAFSAALAWWSPLPIRRAVSVERQSEDIVITERGRSRRVARGSVERVALRPARHGRWQLELIQRGRSTRLELPDRPAAVALRRELGLQHASATFWSISPLLWSHPHFLSSMGVVVALAFTAAVIAPEFAMLPPLAWLALLALPGRRVCVGADGITIHGWGASDYVPLARIAHHSVVGSGGSPHYALVLGCGQRSHTLPMSSASAAHALSDAIAVALSSRRRARRSGSPIAASARCATGSRTCAAPTPRACAIKRRRRPISSASSRTARRSPSIARAPPSRSAARSPTTTDDASPRSPRASPRRSCASSSSTHSTKTTTRIATMLEQLEAR